MYIIQKSTHWLQQHHTSSSQRVSFSFYNLQEGIVSGIEEAYQSAAETASQLHYECHVQEGTWVAPHSNLLTMTGPWSALLSTESFAKWIISWMSSLSTQLWQWDLKLAPEGIQILYTPREGLAYGTWEKKAALLGGARHRRLFFTDGLRLNHLHYQWLGGITAAINELMERLPPTVKIETVVSTLEEVQEAIEAGSHLIILRNMSEAQVKMATRTGQRRVLFELEGIFPPSAAPMLAASGVQFVSSDALLRHDTIWPVEIRISSHSAN